MDAPTKPVKGATPEPLRDGPEGLCSSPNPAQTANPEPDQGHLMAAIQILTEQVSRLTQDMNGPKTQMQQYCDEW
ncbi:hypothetical protein E2C01_061865 [Portunus trituberculatus]|uniref:Uncharacterized protein n=1 Tax=Portunus trituberculatus TaxID=210409 RepID=A0A5B7HCD5_PORTR|nr:hypothetical protein [Portunus trituberculatus]